MSLLRDSNVEMPVLLPRLWNGHCPRWTLLASSDSSSQQEVATTPAPPGIAGAMRWSCTRLATGACVLVGLFATSYFCGLGLQPDRANSHTNKLGSLEKHSLSRYTADTAVPPLELTMRGRPCFFEFNGKRKARCFCQLAGNPGCAGTAWACGKTGKAMEHQRSVTFKNIARAQGCKDPTALLTIPTSYFQHVQALVSWCPVGAAPLLAELIRNGFTSYQKLVAPGVVKHCIHAGWHVSVPWMHLHTICSTGMVDSMKWTSSFAYCETMSKPEEAEAVASKIVAWAGGLKGLGNLSQAVPVPSKCSQAKCGVRGPAHHCSCHWDCSTFHDCCEDYRDACLHSCKAMRCGVHISGSPCSCKSECKLHGTCCEDFHDTCEVKSKSKPDPPLLPSSCKEMGCGNYVMGAPCSCSPECEKHGDCCHDHRKVCKMSCKDLGCGKHIPGAGCACNDRCHQFKDCCTDYEARCQH